MTTHPNLTPQNIRPASSTGCVTLFLYASLSPATPDFSAFLPKVSKSIFLGFSLEERKCGPGKSSKRHPGYSLGLIPGFEGAGWIAHPLIFGTFMKKPRYWESSGNPELYFLGSVSARSQTRSHKLMETLFVTWRNVFESYLNSGFCI